MHALRRLARPTVATAAAVLLLAGCGGDDDNDSNASSSSSPTSGSSASSSSSAESTESSGGDDEVAAFCEQAATFASVGNQLQSASADQLSPLLQDAVSAFTAAEPPAEIAEDWDFVGTALQELADTAASVDPTTPEGEQALQAPTQEFVAAATGPEGTNIQEYVTANCA